MDKLIAWYTQLSPESLAQINQIYCADAHFKDPFNEVQGTAAIERIFRHMFEAMQAPRFVVDECVQQGCVAYVRWDFHFMLRQRAYCIHGTSRFELAADGRVQDHRDYWDTGQELLQKLPFVGVIFRQLGKRFATPQV
ncbi:nuclear transport factor 2 family protein [Lampropedia aestuarii]|uniref:nuclear transport factor 2 family protein n=1 Tax=Lampropedia aestuarii TaxID=2562762 RepID=UPI0024696AE2|nr:nuclear transport factor 2 family protein [Lampropedia aestuarii]MDH5859064.1 nuclear transport factor 2 family protein [Lampropedia aestuarii]